jgi:hypothetical protein
MHYRQSGTNPGETRGSWVMLDRIGDDCWVAQRFLSEGEPEPEPVTDHVRLLPTAYRASL